MLTGTVRAAVLFLVLALGLAGCGGGVDRDALWLYHLEEQVRGPAPFGQLGCGPPTPRCPSVQGDPGGVLRYGLRGDPAVGGTDFAAESAVVERDPATGAHVVNVRFSREGARRFESFTRELAHEGARTGEPQHIAVVVGREILAFPAVDPEAHPNGLSAAAGLQIVLATRAQAEQVAARLGSGR
jgi:preprotein translocase subunit SecD